jgi:hypothetical protein
MPEPVPTLLNLITTPEVLEYRLQRVRACAAELAAYEALLRNVRQPDLRTEGSNLRAVLGERAFGAEQHARLIAFDVLETLNELRDSGQLKAAFDYFVEQSALSTPAEVTKGLHRTAYEAASALSAESAILGEDFSTRVADEFSRTVHLTRIEGQGITVEIRHADETLHRLNLRGNPSAGDPRRISVSEMFAPTPSLSVQEVDGEEPQEIYLQMVASLIQFKEFMYLEARQMSELGPSSLVGGGPFFLALVGVGLLIYGAVEIVVGVVKLVKGDRTGFGDVITGVFLIAAGVCLLAAACAGRFTANGQSLEVPANPPPF